MAQQTPPRPPYFPPPPPLAPKLPLFARTPPAIFPPIMGAFGLGLAWRSYADSFAKAPIVSDLILGGVTLLFLFALVAYAAKLLRRAGTLVEDLRVLPGRAGLSAASLCLALLATTLVPYQPGLAAPVLGLALLTHAALAGLILWVLFSGPPEQRQVTPIWHLSFVGFILLPGSAVPLGYTGLAETLFVLTLVAAVFIYAVSLGQLIRRDPPPPLRPLLAIHLAPASLFGTVALLLERPDVALIAASVASAVFLGLLVKARYLTAAGFSPLWGAFTFPLAAFANLLLMLGGRGLGPLFGDVARVAGVCLLVAVTGLIGFVLYRVLQMWAKGSLAAKTNASTA